MWTRTSFTTVLGTHSYDYAFRGRLDSTFIANRSVTIDGCNVDENFELTECNTSVLTIPCTTNDLAWVQCTLGSELTWCK